MERNMTAGVKIKERSLIARIAALNLGSQKVAIVIGRTIYLHNTSKEEFLQNSRWVKHEMCHIRQFHQHGFLLFIFKYLWESLKKGYHMNRYEIEARNAEKEPA